MSSGVKVEIFTFFRENTTFTPDDIDVKTLAWGWGDSNYNTKRNHQNENRDLSRFTRDCKKR